MEFPVDNNDYPLVSFKYVSTIENINDINDDFNLLDYVNDFSRIISFQFLHDMKNKSDWEKLFEKVKKFKKIIIKDDITINNDEIKDMKNFYLAVYYLNIKKYCNNVFICKEL